MRWNSLRLRLIAGGILAIIIALILAAIALTVIFERHVARTISDDLDVYLNQLVAGLDVSADGQLAVNGPPANPRFFEPLSGLYWQISDSRGQVLRSRSLWDTSLVVPADELAPGEVHHHQGSGPSGSRLQVAERRVFVTVDGKSVPVRLVVASDLARVSAAQRAFAFDLLLALGVLGAVLAAATWVQVGMGLRPLGLLRSGVAEIRSGGRDRLPTAVPTEVGPLVQELNELLEAQEQELERSRGRAADLAHGLKTPLVALSADAARLRAKGDVEAAADIELATKQMRGHVERELARARIGAGTHRTARFATPLRPLVHSLIATLARTPSAERIRFDVDMSDKMTAGLDRTDLAEVLGNLLENAARHAKSRVRVTAQPEPRGPAITVEDDGPGIAEGVRSVVLRRGGRLDESGGAGLGLAIVQDVLEAYGWTLDLATSEWGGLRATIAPGSSDLAGEPTHDLAAT